jgi:hypothetical protein
MLSSSTQLGMRTFSGAICLATGKCLFGVAFKHPLLIALGGSSCHVGKQFQAPLLLLLDPFHFNAALLGGPTRLSRHGWKAMPVERNSGTKRLPSAAGLESNVVQASLTVARAAY